MELLARETPDARPKPEPPLPFLPRVGVILGGLGKGASSVRSMTLLFWEPKLAGAPSDRRGVCGMDGDGCKLLEVEE